MKESTYVRKVPFYKKKQFFSILVGLFFIGIMVFSALYYGMDKEEIQKVEYNGLTFVQTNQGWMSYVNDEDSIILSYNPEEIDEEFEKVSYAHMKTLGKVYLSTNPYDNVQSAIQELYRNGFLDQTQVVIACYEDNEACSELPLKTCEDATDFIGVIILKEANETSVNLESNCLTIEGKNLLMVVDKFILDQYGN